MRVTSMESGWLVGEAAQKKSDFVKKDLLRTLKARAVSQLSLHFPPRTSRGDSGCFCTSGQVTQRGLPGGRMGRWESGRNEKVSVIFRARTVPATPAVTVPAIP